MTKAAQKPGSRDSFGSIHWGVLFLLPTLVWIVYGQLSRAEFLNFDDDVWIYQNPAALSGLTPASWAAAWTRSTVGNWVPLTALSHAAVVQAFGPHAGAHHLVNVALHAASAILLFLVVWQWSGAWRPSAWVAAVFAVHPVHVESVAWVTERKDVLSGFFFILTLLAYTRFVRGGRRPLDYSLALFAFLLGLLSKAMLVTLPFVLLLLDFWPFSRLLRTEGGDPRSRRRALLEKLPFFLLSIVFSALQMHFGRGMIQSSERAPLGARIANAIVSYGVYLRQTVWPARLGVFYPLSPGGPSAWQVVLCLAILAVLTTLALRHARRLPWLPVGWGWFLGMLVPVIGLVQAGGIAHAERYLYLPQIGLTLMAAFTVEHLLKQRPSGAVPAGSLAISSVVALTVLARAQASTWMTSEAVWRQALAVTDDHNFMAHNNLGLVFQLAGRAPEAAVEYERSLADSPGFPKAEGNLGNLLFQQGRVEEAISHYQKALAAAPQLAALHKNLGQALLRTGRVPDGLAHLREGLALEPQDSVVRSILANSLAATGQPAAAIAEYRRVLAEAPGRFDAARNLAWILAACPDDHLRNGAEAVRLAEQVYRSPGGQRSSGATALAAAYAETGRLEEARAVLQNAIAAAPQSGEAGFIPMLRSELDQVQLGGRVRDPSLEPGGR